MEKLQKNQSIRTNMNRTFGVDGVFVWGILFVIGVLFSMNIVSAAWNSTLTNQLTSYYPFDNSIDMYLGRLNLTTYGNNSVANPNGKIGKYMNSTGVAGSYTNISNATNIVIKSVNGWSVNFWINTSIASTSGAGYKTMYQFGNGTDYVRSIGLNSKPYFSIVGTAPCNLDLDCGASCAVINDSSWHMITNTLNATGMTIYLDGTYRISASISGCSFNASRQNHIGAETAITRNYAAMFDEFSIYNRTLDANDVTQLWNSGAGLTIDTPNYGFAPNRLDIPKNNSIALDYPLTVNASFNVSDQSLTANVNLTNVTFTLYDSSMNVISTVTNNLTNKQNRSQANFTINTFGRYYYSAKYCFTPELFFDLSWHDCLPFGYFSTENYNSTFFWGYDASDVVYNTTSYVSRNDSFTLRLNYSSTLFPSVEANFTYNGTTYPSIEVGSGDLVNFTNYILNNASGIFNFTWNLKFTNISGGVSYVTTNSLSQNVSSIVGLTVSNTTCPAGYNTSYLFTFADEGTRLLINANVSYMINYGISAGGNYIYGNLSNTPALYICILGTEPDFRIETGEIDYQTSGYAANKYYLFTGARISRIQTNTTLYELPTSSATTFKFEVTDNLFDPQTNAYLALLRWYPELNSYIVTAMGKTDDKGDTVVKLKLEDVDYRTAVYTLNGTLVQLNNPIRFVCSSTPCSYSLFLPTEQSAITDLSDLLSILTFNKTTKTFRYVWNDPSQQTNYMNLSIYKEYYNTTAVICSSQGTGFTGVLTCDVSAYTGTVYAKVLRKASPLLEIENMIVNLSTTFSEVTGGKVVGLIMSLVLFIFAILTGLYNPIVAIVLGIAALIPSTYVGIIPPIVFAGFAILAALAIHFMRRS